MDDFEKRRIEFYLEETDQITEVWGEYDHERDKITANEDFDNSYNSSDDDVPFSMRVQYLFGKYGTKWFRKKPTQNIRTIQQKVWPKIRNHEHGLIGGMTVRCLHCAAAKFPDEVEAMTAETKDAEETEKSDEQSDVMDESSDEALSLTNDTSIVYTWVLVLNSSDEE
ncbi:hypothetical protein ACI65C_004455 [Semiaphis heraclei]